VLEREIEAQEIAKISSLFLACSCNSTCFCPCKSNLKYC